MPDVAFLPSLLPSFTTIAVAFVAVVLRAAIKDAVAGRKRGCSAQQSLCARGGKGAMTVAVDGCMLYKSYNFQAADKLNISNLIRKPH